MKNQLSLVVVFVLLLVAPTWCVGQYLELGQLSSFEAYTGTGAVANSGTFTGDAGTSAGTLTGFVPPDFTGHVYKNDAVTAQARTDLLKISIHLSDIFVTQPDTHAPAFGGGETITPGVYSVAGAGSVAGTLTLDGGGDTNAVFILEFAGAFTTGAGSTIVLSKGTRACNVFWIAQGAISLAAGSTLKGTLLSFPGAISLGTNCDLEGRMFATTGAITIGAGSVVIAPAGPITIPVNCSNDCAPAPAVDVLGSAANFALFTTAGAVANAGTSGIIGDIGTNTGAISGFADSEHMGVVHKADAVTAQASLDLEHAYAQLLLLPNTVLSHAPAFGSGETLPAGVYFINGAGSLAGTLTLDAQNVPDAIFVFKFAEAFSVAAQSKVIFANGVRRCNVFWIGGAGVATGAVSIGGASHVKGTFLSHGGACSSAAGTHVEGRMLSTTGAIGFSTGLIYTSPRCVAPRTPLPVELTAFTATAEGPAAVRLAWATASEKNSKSFEVERSVDGTSFARLGTVAASGGSSNARSYALLDARLPANAALLYYRLRQVDLDGTFAYSPVRSVAMSAKAGLALYPNPAHAGAATLTGAVPGTVATAFDTLGRAVASAPADASGTAALALPAGLATGVYVVRVGSRALRLTVE